MPVLRASPRLRESPLTLRVFVAFIAVSTCHPLGYIVVIEFEVELIAEKNNSGLQFFFRTNKRSTLGYRWKYNGELHECGC